MMRSYNRMMFEFFRLPHLSPRGAAGVSVEVDGREHLEQAVARGRGVILASSHIGNWELAAVMLAQWGYTLHAVAGVQLTRWLSAAVRETKTELSIHTVSPEDGFRRLLRALEHNDLVALMVDGDIYQHGVERRVLRPRDALSRRSRRARAAHRRADHLRLLRARAARAASAS